MPSALFERTSAWRARQTHLSITVLGRCRNETANAVNGRGREPEVGERAFSVGVDREARHLGRPPTRREAATQCSGCHVPMDRVSPNLRCNGAACLLNGRDQLLVAELVELILRLPHRDHTPTTLDRSGDVVTTPGMTRSVTCSYRSWLAPCISLTITTAIGSPLLVVLRGGFIAYAKPRWAWA
jgi:hypothetical protein